MKSLYIVLGLICLIFIGTSCKESLSDDIVVDTFDINHYSDEQNIIDLLEDTWGPIIDFQHKHANDTFNLSDLYSASDKVSSIFLDNMVQQTTVETDGGYRFLKGLFIPYIDDQEVSISQIDLIPDDTAPQDYYLIVVESGTYSNLDYSFRRESVYYFDKEGQCILQEVTGGYFLAEEFILDKYN